MKNYEAPIITLLLYVEDVHTDILRASSDNDFDDSGDWTF